MVVDVDGFNIRGRMVPKELGISVFSPDLPKADIHTSGIYFNGGLPEVDVSENKSNITYVQRKIHGMPVRFGPEIETVELSDGTNWQKVFKGRAKTLMENDERFRNRAVYIFHKGGLEGKALICDQHRDDSPFDADVGDATDGCEINIKLDNVIDLNSFSCPKTCRLPATDVVSCSPEIHHLLLNKHKWPEHCPQNEVRRLAEWVHDNLTVRGGKIEREPNIDEDELAEMLDRMMMSDNAPKSENATINMLRQRLLKAEKYASPDVIETSIKKIFG